MSLFKRNKQAEPHPATSVEMAWLVRDRGLERATNTLRAWTSINDDVALAAKLKPGLCSFRIRPNVELYRWYHTDTLADFLEMRKNEWKMSESPELMRMARADVMTCYAGGNMGPNDHYYARAALGIEMEDSHPMVSRSPSGARTQW